MLVGKPQRPGAHNTREIEDRNVGVVGAGYGVPISVLVLSNVRSSTRVTPSFQPAFVQVNQDPCGRNFGGRLPEGRQSRVAGQPKAVWRPGDARAWPMLSSVLLLLSMSGTAWSR